MTKVCCSLFFAGAAALWPTLAGAESGGAVVRFVDGAAVQPVSYTYYARAIQEAGPPTPPPDLPEGEAPADETMGRKIPIDAFMAPGASCRAQPACGCHVQACSPAPCAPACAPPCGCDNGCGHSGCCQDGCGHCGHAACGCHHGGLLSAVLTATPMPAVLRASRHPVSRDCGAVCGRHQPCGCAPAGCSPCGGHAQMTPGGEMQYAAQSLNLGDASWTIAPAPPSAR